VFGSAAGVVASLVAGNPRGPEGLLITLAGGLAFGVFMGWLTTKDMCT